VGPPDFVGVGVMKAGTSWWYRLLVDHPAVADVVGRPKELHFFDGFALQGFTAEDIARYQQYFPRPPGTIVGEWTPRYLHDFWTPPLLATAAPGAKFLVVLRDPVERFLSALTHEMSRGGQLNLRLLNEHFGRGQYVDQLRRLWSFVPRERTLVLQYERCAEAPEAELARTYAFLGLDPSHLPARLREPVNPTRFDKASVDELALGDIAVAYTSEHDELASLCPTLDLDLWSTTRSAARHGRNP
jgi:hypothetical protein